jgi:IS30 family transposase
MKKQRHFNHLNQNQRDRLEVLLRSGCKQKEIAKVLKVDPSTISREINKRKRKNGVYDADTAEHKARVKRLYSKYQGMKVEQNKELKKVVIEELARLRSPDEIAGRLKGVGKDAIYKWLYSNRGQQYCQYLCSRRYRRKKQTRLAKREMIKHRIPLFLRPQGENYRHAEGDAFLSPKKLKTSVSVFMVCEKTSQLIM